MLFVLQFSVSDNIFGIFKLFLANKVPESFYLSCYLSVNITIILHYRLILIFQDSNMLVKILVLHTLIIGVIGHGRLISPPGRSTMWRYGYSTPANYDDNQMSCGGFYVSCFNFID